MPPTTAGEGLWKVHPSAIQWYHKTWNIMVLIYSSYGIYWLMMQTRSNGGGPCLWSSACQISLHTLGYPIWRHSHEWRWESTTHRFDQKLLLRETSKASVYVLEAHWRHHLVHLTVTLPLLLLLYQNSQLSLSLSATHSFLHWKGWPWLEWKGLFLPQKALNWRRKLAIHTTPPTCSQ